MKLVNLHFAKTHLSSLVDEALSGTEVVIAKAGKPLVRLVPVGIAEGVRELGQLAGQVTETDDCWTPDTELEDAFYGAPVLPKRRVAERKPDQQR